MKKLFLFFGLMAMTFGSLNAGPVDQQRAQNLGTKFLSATVLGQRDADIQLNLVAVATDLSRSGIDYYVFNVRSGEGFVIIAGDDCVKPVLAYSTTGQYDPSNVAEGFAYTLDAFREEIHYVREHNMGATTDIMAEWESVEKTGNLRSGHSTRSMVGPLCQTTWNQNYPYNSQCPTDPEGNGGYVYAGCVATAMAQVMKFHDWPDQGTGSHTYNPSGYPQQTANYGDTEYHFELMPLALDSTSTEEEIFYIAQFQHHCGIAVDMQYSGDGSGAYSDDVPPALRNYFRYTCDDHITNYNFWGWGGYSNEEWAQMLKDGGLDEGIPLYYSGSDDNMQGGHAFVCDGYDENDYFHYNWGWSGRDDAWCPIGALNTTKYAFNLMNGFTGHILPQGADYYQRADSVADFTLTENANMDGVALSWTNPSLNLGGTALPSIESITIKRNNELVATLTNAQVGAAMSYEDNGLEPGLYEYSIFVTNSYGISRNVFRRIMVGEKCDVVFHLFDDGGDGWKGASISVTDEQGHRIAVVGMSGGSEATVTVPLLRQNLNFIWNHGWYHTNEQYDTDYECSFTINDAEGNELYASGDLDDGVFLIYENNCEFVPLVCYPVENLVGQYVWNAEGDYGTLLTWSTPAITDRLDHFTVFRALASGTDDVLATVPYEGGDTYEFFNGMAGMELGSYIYTVTSTYVSGSQECESEPERVEVVITDVKETEACEVEVFPNPTRGILTIEGTSTMQVAVYDMMGQKLVDRIAEGRCAIDLSGFESGMYLVRVETGNGVKVQRINLIR